MIDAGDTVQCVVAPTTDPQGRPRLLPEVGEVYTITSVYRMSYGLGCTLEGLDPSPYMGYVLWAKKKNAMQFTPGWHYRKLEPVQIGMLSCVGREVETV